MIYIGGGDPKNKSAYEKYLVDLVKYVEDEMKVLVLSNHLMISCYNHHKLAFELVDRVGDREWTHDTFRKAAKLIL
jgi:hypothetical protein